MKKILLVEDDEHLQLLLREELSDDGYDVRIASNGKDALDLLTADGGLDPDLIIMDIRMPTMDGIETLGNIIHARIDKPIIIHSAYSGYRNHVLTMAVDAYVVKSSNFDELKSEVSRLLREKGEDPATGTIAREPVNRKALKRPRGSEPGLWMVGGER